MPQPHDGAPHSPPPGGYRNPYAEYHQLVHPPASPPPPCDHGAPDHDAAQGRTWYRFYRYTAAHAFLPGSGYALAGWGGGWLVTAAYMAIVLCAVGYVFVTGLSGVAAILLRPTLLRVLLIGHLLGIIALCVTVLKLGDYLRPRHLTRPELHKSRAFIAALCVIIALPTTVAAGYLVVTKTTLEQVGGSLARRAGTRGPDLSRANPWEGRDRVNVLLLGSDAGADREGIRTDSMMVVSVNPATGDSVTIGVPRNLQNFPIPRRNPLSKIYPNGYNCGDACLLNAIWREAEGHRDLFGSSVPSPGLTSIVDVLENLLNLRMDQVVVVDFAGFRDAVDAIGGLRINVKTRVAIGGRKNEQLGRYVGITGYIEPGEQVLDGYHAMWYTRSRALDSDFERMKRQRCAVAALTNQLKSAEILARYKPLMDVARDHVKTDIPLGDTRVIGAWLELFNQMQTGTMRSLTLTPQNINVTAPDLDRIHRMVSNATSANPVMDISSSPSGTALPTSTHQASALPVNRDMLAWVSTMSQLATPMEFLMGLSTVPLLPPAYDFGALQPVLAPYPLQTTSSTQRRTTTRTTRPTSPTQTTFFPTDTTPPMTSTQPTITVDPDPTDTMPTITVTPTDTTTQPTRTRTRVPSPSQSRPRATAPPVQPSGPDQLVNTDDAC